MWAWIKRALWALIAMVLLAWVWLKLSLVFSTHEYAQLSPEQQAQADAYLVDKLTPVPAAWEWSEFYPEEGVRLRTGLMMHPNPKGTVVVVPGFTGTMEMLMREIVQLYAAGFSVASLEYRGQGDSWRPLPHPEKGYVEDYAGLGHDLALFAESLETQGQPLFFFSISKGAHITLRMALEQAVDVSAYALIVPMVKINTGDFDYDLAANLAQWATRLGLGALYAPGQSAWPTGEDVAFGTATGCNANPETAQSQSALFAQRETLRTRGTTYRWIKETAESSAFLMDDADKSSLQAPVLMVTAGVDTLVDTSVARAFCVELPNCVEQHRADSRHCITRESMPVYDDIVQSAIAHFERAL